MKILNLSITGSEFIQFIPHPDLTDDLAMKNAIRQQLNIPPEDDFDVYTDNYLQVKDLASTLLASRDNQCYKIWILNQLSALAPKIKGVYHDTVSTKKYTCINAKWRKTFDSCFSLFNHFQVHYKNKPFGWSFQNCRKSFMLQSQLNTHLTVHQDFKPFKWTFKGCNKSYAKNCRLKVHLRSHNGIKPFVWPYEGCGKRFSEKGNMKTHIRTHTGEKPYFCNFWNCKKRFSTQGHLIDHIRSHSDTKPFPCQLCSKAFMRASTLKVHMRDHTGERPFSWQICLKSFKEARSLRSHSKIHANLVHDKLDKFEKIHQEEKNFPLIKEQPTYQELKLSGKMLSTMGSGDNSIFETNNHLHQSVLLPVDNIPINSLNNLFFKIPFTPVDFGWKTVLFPQNFSDFCWGNWMYTDSSSRTPYGKL